MASTSDLDRVASIVLRFMRGPVLLLICVYGTGIAGMVLIPGQDADGNPTQMGFFHAFYFMTYTATTTGFGEIPNEFTDLQRMWAVVCLYMSVIGWIYAIGSIIGLVQNPHFQQALSQKRFALTVSRITEPFVIIAGFGDTGSLLARGLSDQEMRGVVIDGDSERIKALGLRDYRLKMPGLRGDPSVPKTLLDAGLRHPQCRAVVALTSDEEINLKIAIMVRLLNPSVQIICRSRSSDYEAEMKSLGDMVSVVDPFETFANSLCTAIHSPKRHTFDEWLVGVRGVRLEYPQHCPMGKWILCGFGRMGKCVYASLHARGIPMVVIDPNIGGMDALEHKIVGNANRETLLAAGVNNAAGIVVATVNDPENLKTLLLARHLNPNIFIVIRQNFHENEVAFQAGHADLIMQPSLVTARKILLRLMSALMQSFLDYLECNPTEFKRVYERLLITIGNSESYIWTARFSRDEARAVCRQMSSEQEILLGDLIRHPSHRERSLPCVPLVLRRNGEDVILPNPIETGVRVDDEILFCGTKSAQQLLDATMNNPYTLDYLITGSIKPRGYLMSWVYRRFEKQDSAPN